MTSFVGQSPFAYPNVSVAVTVDSTSTIGSGGTNDWWGRSYVTRRTDDVLVMVYRRGLTHGSNTSNLNIRFSDDDGATWTAENTKLGGGAVSGFPMVPSSGNINAGEGMVMTAPSGRLLILLWRVDGAGEWPQDPKGMQWSHSTDGESWSSPVAMTISGISDFDHTFLTDDWFVYNDVIYTAGRIYNADDPTDSYTAFFKSEDDGSTWAYVSDITSAGSDTQEVGMRLVGASTIRAYVRSLNNDHAYTTVSTDLGATWAAKTTVDGTIGISGRHRLYTRAYLRGQANWWKDPVLVMEGFILPTPGSSQPRRNCVWVSRDRGTTWTGPQYIDSQTEDAGYGDIFYDATNDQYVVVSYQGDLNAASLKQYRLTIDGI